MIKSVLFLLTFIRIVIGQIDSDMIYIEGEYERRFYAGESNEECRVACIDSAKSNIIDNYIFNRFGNHIFSDEQRNLCIYELKPLIGEIKIVDEIVIQDDASDENDYHQINEIIENFKRSNNVKIELNRNEFNLGGFKNKYLTVENCKKDIVYQIDSDNIISNSTFKYLN